MGRFACHQSFQSASQSARSALGLQAALARFGASSLLVGLTLFTLGCPNFFKGKPKPVNPPSGGQPSPQDGYLTQSPVVSWSPSQQSALRRLVIKTALPTEVLVSANSADLSVRITLDFQTEQNIDLVGLWSGNVAVRSTLSGRDQVLILASTLSEHPCVERTPTTALRGLCARRVRIAVPKNLAERIFVETLDEQSLQPDRPDTIL